MAKTEIQPERRAAGGNPQPAYGLKHRANPPLIAPVTNRRPRRTEHLCVNGDIFCGTDIIGTLLRRIDLTG